MIQASSPDEGISTFAYRQDGQIRYSQSALQALMDSNGFYKVSYTNYDSYGRPIESGVVSSTSTTLWADAFAGSDNPALIAGTTSERTFTVYDDTENASTTATTQLPTPYSLTIPLAPLSLSLTAVLNTAGIPAATYNQNNLSGNVAVTYKADSGATINAITWYSYDIYGRSEWMVQYNEDLGAKTIHYEYDYKGNVKRVIFQKHKDSELFAHQYTYDANDVLQQVETATNLAPPANFITHANYSYYQTGELKRVNLAQGVQGIDYVYTLGGQLKSINHPSLESAKDPGGDGNDVFGVTLDYYPGDYQRTGTNITTSPTAGADYNGNIKAVRWTNKGVLADMTGTIANQKGYLYNYDRNNWLTGATFGTTNSSTAIISPSPSLNHREGNLTYDANGNIKSLQRTNAAGALVDDLTYLYTNSGKNQLTFVRDAIGDNVATNDIDNQGWGNYDYNVIGQMTRNNKENINYLYNTQGLVTQVSIGANPVVKFFYNERGQRIKKESYDTASTNYLGTDYYALDLSGNTMAIYNKKEPAGAIVQNDLPIFGLNRLGVYNRFSATSSYEITDHLGNVRAVVQKNSTTGATEIKQFADYYPFGEQLQGRNSTTGNYRYAFQGQELDSETNMEAFQLRLWDGRIGRWLSPDPYGQYASPYLGMGNNPIGMIDPDGGFSEPNRKATGTNDSYFDPNDNTYYVGNKDGTWTQATMLQEVVVYKFNFHLNTSFNRELGGWSFDQSWARANARTPTINNNLADRIMNSGRVTFGTQHPAPPNKKYKDDLANADDNIRDAANGRLVHTSVYGHAKGKLVALSPQLLTVIDGLTDDYTLGISELAGGAHGGPTKRNPLGSRHYAGIAVDITSINGVPVNHNNIHFKGLMRRARQLGATEALGPGSPNHGGHVHLGVPRN